MNLIKKRSLWSGSLFCAAMFCLSTSAAFGQFLVEDPGPIDSAGDIGDPDNGVLGATYSGPTTIFGALNFSGDLTDIDIDTQAFEASWEVTNLTSGSTGQFAPASNESFPGPIAVSFSTGGLFWIESNDDFSFEAFEEFDDSPGVDAFWESVVFEFSGAPTITTLGSITEGTYTLDTEGSDFDTELALYLADGTLIAADDDSGTGFLSSLTGTLGVGDYLIVVGGWDSYFDNGWASAGEAGGAFELNLDGAMIASGNLSGNEFGVFGFSVTSVPEPSAVFLLVVALPFLATRKRR